LRQCSHHPIWACIFDHRLSQPPTPTASLPVLMAPSLGEKVRGSRSVRGAQYGAEFIKRNIRSQQELRRPGRRHCLPGMLPCRGLPYFTFAHAHTAAAPSPLFVIKRVSECSQSLASGGRKLECQKPVDIKRLVLFPAAVPITDPLSEISCYHLKILGRLA